MRKKYAEDLPIRFKQNISGLYGAKGDKWLTDLPQTIIEIAEKWSLKVGAVFPNLSFNFVARCADKEGEKYVLKIGVPEKDSTILREKKALEFFNGNGMIKFIKFDEKLCAMILERAVEGKTLYQICGDDHRQAARIAVEVIGHLKNQTAISQEFPPLEEWTNGLRKAERAKIDIAKVKKALRLFGNLREVDAKRSVLHGDLHYDNILSAERKPFLAIDPKGVFGEIGYEIAVFLNDQLDWVSHLPDQPKLLNEVVEIFSEAFDLEPVNLRRWAFAQAVLAAWWMVEDFGSDSETYLSRAELWQKIGI